MKKIVVDTKNQSSQKKFIIIQKSGLEDALAKHGALNWS